MHIRICTCDSRVTVDATLTGELTVLEVNAVPGLTHTSLLPHAADVAGLGFEELVGRLLALAA